MSIEEKLLNLLKTKTSAFSLSALQNAFPNISHTEISDSIGNLEKKEKVKRDNKNNIIYIRKPEEDEQLIFNHIKEAKSLGCSIRDIRMFTKLPMNLIQKILKKLEEKKLINSVKNLQSKTKLYFLFDEIPDEKITGGVFFTNSEIDKEFVDQLMKLVYSYIKRLTPTLLPIQDNPTLKQIHGFLLNSKILSVKICESDLKKLLDVMVSMGLLQQINYLDQTMYRALSVDLEEYFPS